jgi:hypothetical protein
MTCFQYKRVRPANLCDGNEIKINIVNIVARIETGKHQYGYGS